MEATSWHLWALIEGCNQLRDPLEGTKRINTQTSVSSHPLISWKCFPIGFTSHWDALEKVSHWCVHLGQATGTQSEQERGSRGSDRSCPAQCLPKGECTIHILPINASVYPSFSKLSLRGCSVPGTLLWAKNTEMNKKNVCPWIA